MIVKELIEKLKNVPQDYEVTFEARDYYGHAYTVHVDDVNVQDKYERIELIGL